MKNQQKINKTMIRSQDKKTSRREQLLWQRNGNRNEEVFGGTSAARLSLLVSTPLSIAKNLNIMKNQKWLQRITLITDVIE